MKYIFFPDTSIDKLQRMGGGKAANMGRMSQMEIPVPHWFCLNVEAYRAFIEKHNLEERLNPVGKDLKNYEKEIDTLFLTLPLPKEVQEELSEALKKENLQGFVAVRSSGLDEDSPEFSFAGQFSTFLFQKGIDAIEKSIKRCWASAFSERGLSYRIKNGLPITGLGVGVVVQQMVDADVAGVAFSRNPVNPLDRDHVVISSVWGLGEGLVSGELDADHFEVSRKDRATKAHVVEKAEACRQSPQGGIQKASVEENLKNAPSLTDSQTHEVASLAESLEEKLKAPQDIEWAIADKKLYCLQTRPITTLPPESFFDPHINGTKATLWDNSNIVESYSGVTSPLTFTFANNAYKQVYKQFCGIIGVPEALIQAYEPVFRNMLGSIRGRVYYNLINWYKLVILLPGTGNNPSFMETMMGVKQGLTPEVAKIFDFTKTPPKFPFTSKLKLGWLTLYRFQTIDSIVSTFNEHFTKIYEEARRTDFKKLSLPELSQYYQFLDEQILQRWQAPIINDTLCMIFFGLLKKLTEKWIEGENAASLQNDLLCGQGDLESTEPTKMLMRLASKVDHGDPEYREWFLKASSSEIWDTFKKHKGPQEVIQGFYTFLDKYGFRCVNELKLEENDLHDDPTFAINAITSYVRMKAYSIEEMEKREKAIRSRAEEIVNQKLSGIRKKLYFWVTKQARKAIHYRENLRFARTKIFGVIRHLFRAVGDHLVRLKMLDQEQDVFYLTVEEIFSLIEGRGVDLDIGALANRRKAEYEEYRNTPPPPDRFLTYGAAGISMKYPQILSGGDLSPPRVSTDPSILLGTPCCPGIVEGVVRVVTDIKDAEGLNGEILVTERTDPGWVPLYPACSGLLIERGSLLSHSAVVARELGLPTIVGISGGLMTKLKTGQKVRIDAAKGEVKLLELAE